ncbi:hypothetical protein MRB53_034421 [Persea americana]|uniref:Uncharacterized protein n=1 Tax=Persea americana TaxID=3435 RepID=A0ACC2K1U5_PERAE|nr:hypothetical protein MRB53_034421 [Persea americana]
MVACFREVQLVATEQEGERSTVAAESGDRRWLAAGRGLATSREERLSLRGGNIKWSLGRGKMQVMAESLQGDDGREQCRERVGRLSAGR